ncbi:PadR family transcriptional regulator [Fervidobacterium sp. 2310opik-2]|uniref:PadR family transcriptional regulator n=1 Tax=Fervidobacterium sp. 2310opik-2 TaxID=1755815 RepID=UPI0013DF1116|nr:PadR family transcriptional regulator [Fervidobacterium sp. 2310opik-2]KAF2960994.1 PadR family transcriptional regulator [Fervidobacterium sp. 2310opik-2]
MRRKCGCQHGQGGNMHRCEETGFSTGDFLTAVILKLLSQKPMHGYELYEKLQQVDYYPFKHDPSVIYNILRKLEHHGIIEFKVEEGNGGLRKVYSITENGIKYFNNLLKLIDTLKESFEEFLKS